MARLKFLSPTHAYPIRVTLHSLVTPSQQTWGEESVRESALARRRRRDQHTYYRVGASKSNFRDKSVQIRDEIFIFGVEPIGGTQGDLTGCRTGNGEKLSNNYFYCLTWLCSAPA